MTLHALRSAPAFSTAETVVIHVFGGAHATHGHCEDCQALTRVDLLDDDVCPQCRPSVFAFAAEVA